MRRNHLVTTVVAFAIAAMVAVASAQSDTQQAARAGAQQAYSVSAMVGQVNGRAIFDFHVLSEIQDPLRAMAQKLNRGEFRQQASALIAQRLRQLVMDMLVLGEAEKGMSEQQRYGLLNFLKGQREEITRRFGEGSEARADTSLRERYGVTLEQRIDQVRQEVIVRNYLREKLFPKINVSRKDIERYYREHHAEYNPPPGRTIHMMLTRDAAVAKAIEKHLEEGKPFLELAADKRFNSYNPDGEGRFGDKAIVESTPFREKELNEAMLALAAGQHSPRIDVGDRSYWVFVKSISTGQAKSLREAQSEIEQILRAQQFRALTDQYQSRLYSEGSYNPLEEMHAKLMEIVMSTYAPQS